MYHTFRPNWFVSIVLGLWLAVEVCPVCAQQAPPVQSGPLPLDQVVKRLEEQNQKRAQALTQLQATRIYRMEYRGFPGNRDAEMTVKMNYQSPATKDFNVVSQTGSKFIIDHVFKKLLESEQEAADAANRQRTALDSANYEFALEGYEAKPSGSDYILSVVPKSKNKFLYRGKIWVDATDFAVTRIEAEPAKNPSFWIKKTEIHHTYVKVDQFWLPAENHTESWVRLGGKATLSIEYRDYRIAAAAPANKAPGGRTSPVFGQVSQLQ
jgi:outer membrane lipoprotein-sorting protein